MGANAWYSQGGEGLVENVQSIGPPEGYPTMDVGPKVGSSDTTPNYDKTPIGLPTNPEFQENVDPVRWESNVDWNLRGSPR